MIDFKNGLILKLKQDRKTHEGLNQLLISGEEVIGSYSAIRDYVAFTNKRIIVVNVQGVTGKKKDFTSIPYSKIQTFSVETSGVFDLDSELEVYISSIGRIKFEFTGSCDIVAIGKIIAEYALR